jgi:hypothetical protein
MQIIKHSFLIVLVIGFLQPIMAEDHQPTAAPEHEKNITFYVGINPLALIAFLPNGMGTSGTLWGTMSGQEFGISLYGGMHFAKAHSLEMRFSTGPADLVVWDTQLQFGYIWYPLEQFLDWNGGLCSGFVLPQFFWSNRITDYVTFNLTPELLLGWHFRVQSLAIDLWAGWNLASVTWSNMPYTQTAARWTQLPYNLTLMAGIAWVFKSGL